MMIGTLVTRCGRSIIPTAFRMQLHDILHTIKVDEQLPSKVEDALDMAKKLDADRSIPWVKEGKDD